MNLRDKLLARAAAEAAEFPRRTEPRRNPAGASIEHWKVALAPSGFSTQESDLIAEHCDLGKLRAYLEKAPPPAQPKTPRDRLGKKIEGLLSIHLKARGVHSLWHIAHLDNLEGILARGICCRDQMSKHYGSFRDIADHDIINRRRMVREFHNLDTTRHVLMFFADNTPMLARKIGGDVKKGLLPDPGIILLEISSKAANFKGVKFSDGNLASNSSLLFDSPAGLQRLDWSIMQSRNPAYGASWKRVRSAEVLLPITCPPRHIKVIHVQKEQHGKESNLDRVRRMVKARPILDAEISCGLTKDGAF